MLIAQSGPVAGQNWVLAQDTLIIGREPECDIVIPDRQVTRRHAQLVRTGGTFTIEDLGSKNGTWLNGNRVEGMREISDGDEIHVALKVRLRFLGNGVTAPNTEGLPDKVPSIGGKGRLKIDIESRQGSHCAS